MNAWQRLAVRVVGSRNNNRMRFSLLAATTTTTTLSLSSTLFLNHHSSIATAAAFVPTTTSLNSSTSSSSSFRMASSSSSAATATTSTQHGPLTPVHETLVNSWPRMLSAETAENLQKSRQMESLPEHDDNRTKRPVLNGHYVLVKPTGLKDPRLVLYSHSVAHDVLHLTTEQVESKEFVEWVSGNRVLSETWSTPYALSIMGTRYTNNCPYGTGNGYGDGRAISIGEVAQGQELQLKGAGKTPFHRGADGRAVLRSSIREFLASEAMHWLGVSTTRALSLVVSETDKVHRPWYSDNALLRLPDENDPRLAKYTPTERKQILQQLRNEKADPNILVEEKAAITCRVAPSFVRVGHLDLFARRVERQAVPQTAKATTTTTSSSSSLYDTSTLEWKELHDMVWHACYREYKETAYDPFIEQGDLASAATVLLNESAEKIATMVANWIRVGFAQGNFNADNCLVGGRTMDYGPFGFIEEYNPLFAKWTGSGQHFGFLNQPNAAFANYNVLVASVTPVICAKPGESSQKDFETVANPFLERAAKIIEQKVNEVFRVKLGFQEDMDAGDDIWGALEPLMRRSRVDWTIFFRQLTYVVRDFPDGTVDKYEDMLAMIEGDEEKRAGSSAFYEPLDDGLRQQWINWIQQWRKALQSSGALSAAYDRMVKANPKYILREWMLVDAYTDAANDQEAELFNLYDLIQRPYDEGTERDTERYYRRAPEDALTKGGTGFMS